jgi:hypothetical protein
MARNSVYRYAVYHWPSLYGTPKLFRTKFGAWLHSVRCTCLFGAEIKKIEDGDITISELQGKTAVRD